MPIPYCLGNQFIGELYIKRNHTTIRPVVMLSGINKSNRTEGIAMSIIRGKSMIQVLPQVE
jgi:hypothetical protein